MVTWLFLVPALTVDISPLCILFCTMFPIFCSSGCVSLFLVGLQHHPETLAAVSQYRKTAACLTDAFDKPLQAKV